jgi:hypothetical protein
MIESIGGNYNTLELCLLARAMCFQLANINGLLRLQVERRTALVCIMTDTDALGRWMGDHSD